MAQISINSDATQITLSHPELISDFTGSIVLTRKNGCNSTVLPVDTSAVTVSNNSIIVGITNLYGLSTNKTRIDDGVYSFALSFNYPGATEGSENNILVTFCMVVDYNLKCKILNNGNSSVLDKYKAMFYSNDCDKCDCSYLCILYNNLIENYVDNYVGCSSCNES